MIILAYTAAVISFFVIILLLTFGARGWGYVSIDSIVANLHNDFLIGLYVLLPVVVVFLFTIATPVSIYSKYNWTISLGIGVVRLVILLISSRGYMVRKTLWLVMTMASIILSIYICKAVITSRTSFSPTNSSPVIMIMWFVVVLVAAKLLGDAKFGNLDEDELYRKNVLRLFSKYHVQFNRTIGPLFKKDPIAFRILFAIMIAEDTNRPGIVRLVERALFPYRTISTTGIMQVTAKEYLSNNKSVVIAQEIIGASYQRHSTKIKEDYGLVRAVAYDYNGGVYPELVADIYFILKEKRFKYLKDGI